MAKAKAKTTTRPTTDAQILAYITKNYGDLAPFMKIAELKTVLFKAAREGWDANVLQGALERTKWWRRHDSVQRNWQLASNDPAEQKRLKESLALTMAQEFEKLYGSAVRSPDSLIGVAESILAGKKSYAQWLYTETQHAKTQSDSVYGTSLEETAGAMRSAAEDMLVPMGQADLERWAKDVTENRASQDDFRQWLRDQAAGRFPGISTQISKGSSPRTLLGGYTQMASDEWERPVDFNDPFVQDTLSRLDQDGMPTPLWKFQQQLRQTDEWRGTKKATDMAYEFVDFVGKTFGRIA